MPRPGCPQGSGFGRPQSRPQLFCSVPVRRPFGHGSLYQILLGTRRSLTGRGAGPHPGSVEEL